jgi:DHA1 family tetracycline resistance protein-like MFS transporter
MGFVLPKAIPLLGEWKAGAVGLIFTGLALIGHAFAFQGWMVYAVIIVTCLEALADPPLRSIASAKVPPSAQGELQGALSSISSFTTILGPLMFAQIFSIFTAPQATVTFAGAPYVLGAIFVALAIAVYILKVRPIPAPVDDGGAASQAV